MASLSLTEILLANLALALGACLQGVAGYGIGTLSAPLVFLINPAFLPGAMVINATLLNVLMLVRHRASVELAPVRHAIGGALVGIFLASTTLHTLSTRGFDLTFGALILLAVALSIAGFKPRLTRRSSVLAGGLSGYMGTITAVGGPPMALIYQNEPALTMRANLSAFFFVVSCITVAALTLTGHVGARELYLVAVTFPGVILGFWLSKYLVRRVPLRILPPIVLTIAALAGLGALVRGFFG